MKYIVILADGMADRPVAALGGKTPLEAAVTPEMDSLAGAGVLGTCRTVPEEMTPGSDVANLAVLGCDPRRCACGRSSLEALSLGLPMEPGDVVYRCNLVTLSEPGPYPQKLLLDHSAGEITTLEADQLMDAVRARFTTPKLTFYTGTGYRQLLLWKGGALAQLEPPHDHLGQAIGSLLPENPVLRNLMENSFSLLNTHPVNRERAAKGLGKGNSLWFWGCGTKPELPDFFEKTGKQGAMIAGVDLLKGIAVGMGMTVMPVAGANGTLETNYEGKADAALEALLHGGKDFAYVHIEAPDEMGHQGRVADKIKAIESIDRRLIARIRKGLVQAGEDYRLLLLPDHPTPVELRKHTGDPVPFVLFDSRLRQKRRDFFSERTAAETGIFLPEGFRLLDILLEKESL